MNATRLVLAAMISCAAFTAQAAAVSYSFGTGGAATPTVNFPSSAGNSATYGSGSTAVTITAYGSNGIAGNISQAYLNTTYCSGTPCKNELAVTSQASSGGSGYGELNGSNQPNIVTAGGTTYYEHAMDNDGGYEALLLKFTSATTLSSLSIGFPASGSSTDSDATVLVYKPTGGQPAAPVLVGQTFDALLTSGWQIVDQADLFNIATKTGSTATINSNMSSQYWMVGAYMNIGANKSYNPNPGASYDYIKVNGFTTTGLIPGQSVPEPSSIALFGIAAAALYAGQRRRARAA